MKKMLLLLILCSFLTVHLDVVALSASATTSDEPEFSNLKAEYDKGVVKNSVSNSQMITLYGMSVCNGSTCTVTYAGNYSNNKDAILNSVTCSGGESRIFYQAGGSGKTNLYDETKSQNGYSGTVYWAEEYNITCTKDSNGELLTNQSSGSNNTSNNTSNNSSSNSGYNSSTTTDNPEQGVTSYFIILGVISFISYIFMIFVKKLNLFKNI